MGRAILAILMMLPFGAYAGGVNTGIKEVGRHYPIVTFEKSINPENILIAHTQLNNVCEFQMGPETSDLPTLDFYWLMNRETYKVLYSMFEGPIRDRIKVAEHEFFAERKRAFWVSLKDLNAMHTDLPDNRILVKAEMDAATGSCAVYSYVKLGPSDGNATIRLEAIHSELGGFINPKPVSVTLKGADVTTGAPVKRTYSR